MLSDKLASICLALEILVEHNFWAGNLQTDALKEGTSLIYCMAKRQVTIFEGFLLYCVLYTGLGTRLT